ncbi:hypothetical protein GCK72_016950 [Caenorhabditis remanei]|uniref:Uncharacterized protein n=2 Tax=Caenorhabditis remanei TaxID=31234 RepID=A0A6A5G5Y7_CAERE|nr:hypothetical protein GCK72_016950 [Caenorhabditis remanei]KAF1750400.1 hypothetical protein GCK72_016950 [Caenorhabditis remanei]
MASSGPRWGLYPLLAVVAVFEFALGGSHIAYCSPLFFLLFPFINATFGLVTAFHAIFLRYPNRCDFYLQLTCSSIGFFFFFSSLMETYCINEFKYADETIKDGVCHGLKYRTIAMVGSCNDLLANLQLSILDKLGWEPKEREWIRFFTSISLTILSGTQLLICTFLTFYSAVETKIRLYSYHYQVVISIFLIVVSFFHLRYCCTFFFLHLPLAIGLFSLLQGVVSWRTKCHGSTTRAVNIVGAAFAVLLNATTSFGIFCWFNRNTVPHMITRHCHWLSHREAYCMRVVHFTHPYIDWLPQETEREIAAIQITVHTLLFIFSCIQFAISMRSAFSTKKQYLYY